MRSVDPWRFAGGFLKRVLSARIPDDPAYTDIPWAAIRKPIGDCRVALLSTAGLSMKDDEPFDMQMERQNPMIGDPSWRRLRSDATSAGVEVNHLHIDTGYILRDLNVALPVDRLRELASDGIIGEVADSHYSIMGYQGNDSMTLERESAPEIARSMQKDEVDLALLVPV